MRERTRISCLTGHLTTQRGVLESNFLSENRMLDRSGAGAPTGGSQAHEKENPDCFQPGAAAILSTGVPARPQ
jgi:hypothetical protein